MNLRDEGSFGFEVGVAVGQGADVEQVAVAEVIGESGELPAKNHHVGRAESQGEFIGRRVRFVR